MTTENPQKITIAGAGIMGLMSAYTLARAGHAITLYDPAGFPPHTSASYIAGGMLAPYSEIDLMTPDFVAAGLQSIDIWADIARDLNIHFTQTGSLLIAHTEDTHMLDRFETHLPSGSAAKIHAQDKEPALPRSFDRALFLAQEAAIHPQQAMQALCTALEAMPNATLKQEAWNDEATSTDHTIDCRGHSTDDPDLRGVKGEIALVENPDIALTHTIRLMHPRYPLYIVPRPNNIFMIGATQIESNNDTSISLRSAMELLSALYSLHPSFGDAKILDLQAGIRPAYPDNLPRITRKHNTITANGLFRHGYLLSPIIARDIAHMIENEQQRSIFSKEAA